MLPELDLGLDFGLDLNSDFGLDLGGGLTAVVLGLFVGGVDSGFFIMSRASE